jgi:urease accessory protein UreF
MLVQVNGLPLHVLLVHAVVVLVPLSAALVVATATWPAARRRLGLATPAVALLTFAVVPLTTHAGEWLQARVPDTQLVRAHVRMGDSITPFALLLLALAVAAWWWPRRQEQRSVAAVSDGPGAQARTARGSRVGVALAVASVLVAIGAVVQVVRIGDSGAKASWQDKVAATPHAVPGEGH